MLIFSLETSCDETSAAVIKAERGGVKILSNIVSSQIDIHKKYGGVVPEVAARCHLENILPVIGESLAEAKIKPKDIDLIAVTAGPGLITSLLVGVETAKALSFAWQKPLLPVNHMYAHIAANFLTPNIKFPALCLVVSGGHTELVLLKSFTQFKKIGQTVDDAVGEAFDKVAKLLNLGYPGGPVISARVEQATATDEQSAIKFPRPMINSADFNFSFSGLKTAVLYAVKKMRQPIKKETVNLICAEFQQAVVDVLIAKTIKAARQEQVKTILLAGGVAANKKLRHDLEMAAKKSGLDFFVPPFGLCTDNAAMIGSAAYYLFSKKKPKPGDWKKIKANPNLEI